MNVLALRRIRRDLLFLVLVFVSVGWVTALQSRSASAASTATLYDADFTIDGDGFDDHSTGSPPANAPASENGGAAPNGWTVSYTSKPDTDNAGNSFSVDTTAGGMSILDWGGEAQFVSQSIDISSVTVVDIVADGETQGDDVQSAADEFFEYFYILDGGAEVVTAVSLDGTDTAGTAVDYSITGLNVSGHTTLQVGFRFDVNGTGDGYLIRSFEVVEALDTTPPVIQALSPVDGATSVRSDSNLEITFDENVQKGTGNLTIHLASDDSVVQTIDVTDAAVTVSGATVTIDPPSDFSAETYYINITSGAIEDTAGNDFAGITDAATWNFTVFIPSCAGAKLNEFQANPPGTDPSDATFELKGNLGESFNLWILSVDSDDDGSEGVVDRVENVTGTFDLVTGVATIMTSDLENPSFTIVLLDSFIGSAGVDIDADGDGTPDNIASFGTVCDAIGIPDENGDVGTLYGAELGGADFAYTGSEPEIVFRDGLTDEWFAVNIIGGSAVYNLLADDVGNATSRNTWDTNPTSGTTFGSVNPAFSGSPTSVFLESFTATANTNQTVTLNWQTSAEFNHTGFNIYRRAVGSRDSWMVVNEQLIGALGTQGLGATYQYIDETVDVGDWEYLLEDVENNGDTFRHTEFISTATISVPTMISLVRSGASSYPSFIVTPVMVVALMLITIKVVYINRQQI